MTELGIVTSVRKLFSKADFPKCKSPSLKSTEVNKFDEKAPNLIVFRFSGKTNVFNWLSTKA